MMQAACKAFIFPNPHGPQKNATPKSRASPPRWSLMGNAEARRQIKIGCVTFTGAVAKMRRQRRESGCTHPDGGSREMSVSREQTSIRATGNVRFVPGEPRLSHPKAVAFVHHSKNCALMSQMRCSVSEIASEVALQRTTKDGREVP
jgi:hypothetical protein